MALSIRSKLINCGEVLDWTLLLEGTGHVLRDYISHCINAVMHSWLWYCRSGDAVKSTIVAAKGLGRNN